MQFSSSLLQNSSDLNLNTNRLIDRLLIKILFTVIMALLCLVTTFGNICVIYLYRRTLFVGNIFIISLACADLIVGCFVMPLASIYAFTDTWTMSLPLCQIWLIADYTASTASILNLLTLSIDRYWSINFPFSYLSIQSKTRAFLTVCGVWFISLLWIIPIIGWPYFFNQSVRYVPSDKCNTEYDKNLTFKILTALFNFYLPLFTMICINTKIYVVIRKRYINPSLRYQSYQANLQFLDQLNNCMNEIDNNYNSPAADNLLKERSVSDITPSISSQNNKNKPDSSSKLQRIFKDKKFETSGDFVEENFLVNTQDIKQVSQDLLKPPENPIKINSISNNSDPSSSISKNRIRSNNLISIKKKISRHLTIQEKAFKQLLAIVTCFTFCFLPYFICFVIVAVCEDCVSEQQYTLTIWLGYLNSTLNPFIYALLNKSSPKNPMSRKHTNLLFRNLERIGNMEMKQF